MIGIGNNLKRNRLMNNLSLKEAGKKLNMSATAIAKYEKEEIIPDSSKIIQFANAYGVKAAQLIKIYNPPKINFLNFKKKRNLRGKKLELLESTITEDVCNYLEVINLNNPEIKPVLKKYKCNNINDAENVAISFRKFINISNIQPVTDLINILENIGVIIIQLKSTDNKFNDFDGFSEIIDSIPFIIIRNNIEDGAKQRFTIAHELGHLILNIKDKMIDNEKMCDRFARGLLMPKEAVVKEFGNVRKNVSFYELIAFKNEYKVSFKNIIIRLKELNIISEYTYKKLSIQISQDINTNNNILIPEVSYQYKKLVHKLEINNIITKSKACELLGISSNEYNEENYNY